jgi:hypothetical protein
MDLALGFSAGSFADKITPSDPQGGQFVLATRMKSSPAWMVDLLARGTIEVAGGTVLIPYVNMAFGGEGVSWNTGEASAPENSGSHFLAVVGADLRIQPLEKVLIYPGAGIRYGRIGLDRNGEEMVNNWALSAPFVGVALDARMADWAFFRMGVRQSMVFSSTYNGIQRVKESGSTTDVSLGLGFRLGRVDLDLRVNPALLTQGPQIVTGKTLEDGFAAEAGIRFMW